MVVADLISVEEAYGQDPVTGEIDMDKFRQFAAQQEQIQANKPQASREMQYLAANPDVLLNAQTELAKASRDNERLRTNPIGATAFIENVARQHYLNFGKQEGREGFGIIDPRMKGFANVMANTYDMDDPGTQGGTRPEFYTGASTLGDMEKFVSTISQPLYNKLIDRFVDDETNPDKAPGRVDEVIKYMFTPNSVGNTGYEIFGGDEALLEAYDQIGVTGQGKSYADKQIKTLLDLANKYEVAFSSLTPGVSDQGPRYAGELNMPVGDAARQIVGSLMQVAPLFSPNAAAFTLGSGALKSIFGPRTFQEELAMSLGFPSAEQIAAEDADELNIGMGDSE